MRRAVCITVIANIFFGLTPVYWKFLSEVDNLYILGHRMLWSILFTLIFAAVDGKLALLRQAFHNRRALLISLASGVTIVGNWALYVWAVNAEMVADTSLAYYMSPLIVFLLSVVLFKERCTKWEGLAVILAALGIVCATVLTGAFPWVAVLLAVTFAAYGALKKIAGLDSAVALTVEMILLLPVTLIYLGCTSFGPSGQLASLTWWQLILLVGTGFMSSFPLWLYGKGINQLPLSTVSFLQYLWPTTSLVVSIFLFHEEVSAQKLACFALIWAGLLLFSLSKVVKLPECGEKEKKTLAKWHTAW